MPIRELDANTDSLTLEADLPVPPSTVFDYLVTPDLLIRWWPPQVEVDARPGGGYVMSWPNQGWHLRGEFTDFDPGNRVAFTWHWDHEPDLPTRLVSIHLEPTATGTLMRLIHGAYGQDAIEQADRASHREGWLHFLGRLEQAIASG